MKPYFDTRGINRQRLLWTVATRKQLERWEPFVADAVRLGLDGKQLGSAEIWSAEIEHHFALIAARNLIRALEIPPPTSVEVDRTMRDEIVESRDLLEHWDENAPVFNVTPRVSEPPRKSGQTFAERNPRHTPYDWLRWSGTQGPQLSPNVPALSLHRLLDGVEDAVLGNDPGLRRFIPHRSPSLWQCVDGLWWPVAKAKCGGTT